MRAYVLASLALLAVACSATPDDGPATSDQDLVSGGVCATLDYGPRGSASELYRFFADDAEANTFITAVLPQLKAQGAESADAEVAGVDSDPKIVAMVAEVFAAYQKVFPVEMAGLTKAPPVVMMKTATINAFALGPGIAESSTAPTDKSPWLFVVNTGLLEHGMSDVGVESVIAHELGHLILQTFVPKVASRVRHAYLLDGSEDGIFGEAQAPDPAVSGTVATILGDQGRVGVAPQLGMGAAAAGAYERVLGGLIASRENPTPESDAGCQAFITQYTALAQAQAPFFTNVGQGSMKPRTPTPAEQATLDELNTGVLAEAEACFSVTSATGTLHDIAAALAQLPADASPADADAVTLPIEKQVDLEMPDAPLANRLLRAEGLLRAELLAARTNPAIAFDKLRVYDFEEDADDASARIMTTLGKTPSVGELMMIAMSPDNQAACKAAVAAGQPIDFGEAYDAHPLSCWRYYHEQQFTKALGTCTPSATKRAPLDTKLPPLNTKADATPLAPANQLPRSDGAGLR